MILFQIKNQNWIKVPCHSMSCVKKLVRKTTVSLLSGDHNHQMKYQIKLTSFGPGFCDSYEKKTHGDIEALAFSKLSIEIGYILLKHPVVFMFLQLFIIYRNICINTCSNLVKKNMPLMPNSPAAFKGIFRR